MSAIEDLLAWLREQVAEDEHRARAVSRSPLLNMVITVPRGWGKGSTAAHINNWMPPRTAAECEFKRKLLEIHVVRSGTGGPHDRVAICNEDGDVHPCDTVRALAELYSSPYLGRQGYRKEWLA